MKEMAIRLKEEAACVVCKDQDRNIVLQPCSHLCICQDCSEAKTAWGAHLLVECPLCRIQITQRQRIYS